MTIHRNKSYLYNVIGRAERYIDSLLDLGNKFGVKTKTIFKAKHCRESHIFSNLLTLC